MARFKNLFSSCQQVKLKQILRNETKKCFYKIFFFLMNQKRRKASGDNLTTQPGWDPKATPILYHHAQKIY